MAEKREEIAPKNHPEEENNNVSTISTKLSTDQLICKTPQESPGSSVKLEVTPRDGDNSLLYLGVAQLLFGGLMVAFGIMVLVHDASLGQLGCGIWGGCWTMATGIAGVLAAAKDWCPLKSTPQKVAHTAFLAFSLVSLAISQLVVALAATGLGRDLNTSDYQAVTEELQTTTTQAPSSGRIYITLPLNYLSLVSNAGLLVVAGIECVLAAIASYKSSRVLCPCFRRDDEEFSTESNRHALVSSWLGKQNPQLFIVAAPPNSSKGSKLSGGLTVTPIFALPQQPVISLIPAPLGSIPSPTIPPVSRRDLWRDRRNRKYLAKLRPATPSSRRSRSKSRERSMTQEDVVKTYTGLDKAIAEEFIDICDSRNASLCSDSSCSSSCQRTCSGGCNSNSDVASREYLIN